jgi:hypothetical protein
MISVIMLNVVMLSGVAPWKGFPVANTLAYWAHS